MVSDFDCFVELAKQLYPSDSITIYKDHCLSNDKTISVIFVKEVAGSHMTYQFKPWAHPRQAARLEQWLVKDYVIYYTPRQSHDWRVSFQKAPQGKHRWSYFDVKHDNSANALFKARFEAAMIIIRQRLNKEKDE